MANGEKAALSPTGFVFRRVVPWLLLFGVVYYIFSIGRTYVTQKPRQETNPLAMDQPAAPKQKVLGKAKVVSPTLNFRDKPSISDGSIVQRLEKGTILDVVGTPSKEWLKVQTAQGTVGYISSSNIYVQYTPLKKKKK